MYINFSYLPNNSKLFLDYLYRFSNLKAFYPYNFRDREFYPLIFNQNRKTDSIHRERVYDIIKNQYQDNNPSQKTQNNIELLKKPNTLAVVTGQQVGLFGGPLYTLYKTITTIKLCNLLSEEFDSYNFVPVFWMETEDHDLEEVSQLITLDNEGNIKELHLFEKEITDENRKPVGEIKFGEEIKNFVEQYQNLLRGTDFSSAIFSSIHEYYSPGSTFADAFRKLIFSLFDKYGLIIFNPADRDAKKLLQPLFLKEIQDFRKHSEALVNISASLDDIYHAQVKVKPVNLFMYNEGNRHAVEPTEEGFRLKNKRIKLTKEELTNLVENSPELFSPNVLLRPVCQDFIFPTAFYVAGPAEVAYFAQSLVLYDFFKISRPVIFPRASVTLIEKNINSLITKYKVGIEEVFLLKDKLPDKMISNLAGSNIEDIFTESRAGLDTIFLKLKSECAEVDPQLSDMSEKYKQKVFSVVNEFQAKTNEAHKRKYDIVIKQSQKLVNNLFPVSVMQERVFNYTLFANKYGQEMLELLFNEIKVTKFEHQIINL